MGTRAETTKKEKAILKFIETQVLENGYPPSVREIGKAIGLSSTAPVHAYLEKLEKDGWTRIRTENGNVGFVKSTKLTNYTTTRDDWEEEKQITGKVNMFWDYYSKYVQAPDRTGQVIEGVNVVSPTFFYIDSNGNLKNKIGESGKKYIEWAH